MDETAKILFLDDEDNILRSFERLFIDDDIRIFTCADGSAALDLLKGNDISVVVSDNLMPGMMGVEFLQHAKLISPDSVRIMLTGHADVRVALDAVNKGGVHKLITKPWDDNELRITILDSIDRHKVVQSLRNAGESSLYSLAQTIELKDPYTKGHCDRVATYAVAIAQALGLEEKFIEDIRHGSWLHDCGKIGVPDAILNHPGPLSYEQMDVIKKHPTWGADIAGLAHLPQTIINIILHHHERCDGTGYPSGLKGDEIPLEARIVNVADIYDALTSERPYRGRMSRNEAITILNSNKGTYLDALVVGTFVELFGGK